MKKFCDFITVIASILFLLSLGSIESALEKGGVAPFVVLLISGIWFVCYGMYCAEERRTSEWR
jgi:hypothetical protein